MIALIVTAAARIPVCSRAPIPPEAMANQWLCLGLMVATFLAFYTIHRWSTATMERRAKEIE